MMMMMVMNDFDEDEDDDNDVWLPPSSRILQVDVTQMVIVILIVLIMKINHHHLFNTIIIVLQFVLRVCLWGTPSGILHRRSCIQVNTFIQYTGNIIYI